MQLNIAKGALLLGIVAVFFGSDIMTVLGGLPRRQSPLDPDGGLSLNGRMHISYCNS
jgi:hypothetical protein